MCFRVSKLGFLIILEFGSFWNFPGQLETLYYVDDSSAERVRMLVSGRKKFNVDPDDVSFRCDFELESN